MAKHRKTNPSLIEYRPMNDLVAATPFRRLACNLVSPIAERFCERAWKEGFSTCDTTEEDEQLLRAALWIGERMRDLYGSMPNRFALMDRTDAMVLGIGTINEHYRRISIGARAAAREASDQGAQCFDALVNTRMSNDSGLSLPSADFVETMIDAMHAWLFDAARTKGDSFDSSKTKEIEQISSELVSFYTMRQVLKRLWDRALYQGYRLGDDLTWTPPNRRLAELHEGWLARNDAVFMASPAHLLTAWRNLEPAQRRSIGLQKTVTGARDAGKGVRLKVERATYRGKRAPLQALNKAGLKDSYLAPIDPNFLGAGRCVTDDQGRYRFITIKPGAYPWGNHFNAWRPNHIHFSLFGPSILTRLITQMYFPGDPLLELDPIFNGVPAASRQLLVAKLSIELSEPEWAPAYEFNICLRGRLATPLET